MREVLDALGEVTPCGPLGSGAALKLVLISAAVGGVALVAEALRLGGAVGLPEELVRDRLARGPLAGAVARAYADASHFPVALAAKDVALATGHAPCRSWRRCAPRSPPARSSRTGTSAHSGRTVVAASPSDRQAGTARDSITTWWSEKAESATAHQRRVSLANR